MSTFLWKWLLRPVVIALAGTAGVAAIEESPTAGFVFLGISLLSIVMLLYDISRLLA